MQLLHLSVWESGQTLFSSSCKRKNRGWVLLWRTQSVSLLDFKISQTSWVGSLIPNILFGWHIYIKGAITFCLSLLQKLWLWTLNYLCALFLFSITAFTIPHLKDYSDAIFSLELCQVPNQSDTNFMKLFSWFEFQEMCSQSVQCFQIVF